MYHIHHKYKSLTLIFVILLLGIYSHTKPANQIAIYIKSLSTSEPVSGAVIDMNTCNLGKFYSNSDGKVVIPSNDIASCVMYISASGYMSLVKSFSQKDINSNNEITFFMQHQDKYKLGQVWSTEEQKPISGVEITYTLKNKPSQQYSTMSDKHGKFSLILRKKSAISLRFYHPDYKFMEKDIYATHLNLNLGRFFLQPHNPDAVEENENNPILEGVTARKFSYEYTRVQHIIVLDKVLNESAFQRKRKKWTIKQKKVDQRIWYFLGPFYSRQMAEKELPRIRKVYSNARIDVLP